MLGLSFTFTLLNVGHLWYRALNGEKLPELQNCLMSSRREQHSFCFCVLTALCLSAEQQGA